LHSFLIAISRKRDYTNAGGLRFHPKVRFIMTAQEPRESSAMTAIAELMLHLHDALEQEKKPELKES
jgi:hypothetical protein